MDTGPALLTGLVTGFAIAMQVGAVSLLLIETAVARGTAAAIAGGMGVATVDLALGGVATVTGGVAGAALSQYEGAIRIGAAVVLAAIALSGIVGLLRERRAAHVPGAPAHPPGRSAPGHFARFVGLTAVNPLTIASFAAVAAALAPGGPVAAIAFVAGVGAGSAAWHLVLAAAAGHARRWLGPAARERIAIGGRVAVLLLAAHLAISA
jgi:threonine/homoserine/homoserine lactone efflux protein